VIVPRVRVQSRVPGFKEKSLVVIEFETNDPDVCKRFMLWLSELVDMARNFGVLVKTQLALPFSAPNSGL